MLRAAVERGQQAVAAELGGHTPTPTLGAAWSEAMRTTVSTTSRLVAGASGAPGTALDMVRLRQCRHGKAVPGSDGETLVALADDVDDQGKTHALTLAAEVHAVLEAFFFDWTTTVGWPAGFGTAAATIAAERQRHETAGAAEPDQDRGVVMLGLLADAWSVTEVERRERLRPHVIAAVRATSDSAQGDAAGRHLGAVVAAVAAAHLGHPSGPGRPQVGGDRPNRQDRPLGRALGGFGGADDDAAPQRRRRRFGDRRGERASSLQDCYVALSRIAGGTLTAGAGPWWVSGERVDDVVWNADLRAPRASATLRTIAREVDGVRRKLEFLSSMPT